MHHNVSVFMNEWVLRDENKNDIRNEYGKMQAMINPRKYKQFLERDTLSFASISMGMLIIAQIAHVCLQDVCKMSVKDHLIWKASARRL